MPDIENFDKIAIDVKSQKILNKILKENPRLEKIIRRAKNEDEARAGVREWVLEEMKPNSPAMKYHQSDDGGRELVEYLKWRDYAAIRLLDYIDNGGRAFVDLNLGGQVIQSHPIKLLWLAVNQGIGRAKPDFFLDLLNLFRQFTGKNKRRLPKREEVEAWMERYPAGLDPRVIELRQENRDRILDVIIEKIDQGEISDIRFKFPKGMSHKKKFEKALEWWQDWAFHYNFAVRSPDLLNQMLDNSLEPNTMDVLYDAQKAGIPFFVNPYYLSLLQVKTPDFAIGADLAIRDYIIYTRQLVDEFGSIVAWEKEDEVQAGKPNAAGWILPSYYNIHRRYPEVGIFIPDSMGRACGGLCASCQRMYVFQSGFLNFDLDKLRPDETWEQKMIRLLKYFEKDSQLRDILITGGDAFMSSDKSLKKFLQAVYNMAKNKRKANERRADGEKYAEMVRVRLGTRLPVYLPQRISPELVSILAEFKEKASRIGIKQFVVQTHFVSPMEVTPEAHDCIKRLISAGWTVTNQLVFTAAASRRGHTASLRQVLNEVGVLSYYTFTVKGYRENSHNFTPNARLVQEKLEEKAYGVIPIKYRESLKKFPLAAESMVENIAGLRREADLPFLATDRSVLNIPAVGKSLAFRVIGITHDGRRILRFDHDPTRPHSPIIEKMGKVVIIEAKSIGEYLRQLENMGEDTDEYKNIFGYSVGLTEPRMPIFEYPPYDYRVTDKLTNFEMS